MSDNKYEATVHGSVPVIPGGQPASDRYLLGNEQQKPSRTGRWLMALGVVLIAFGVTGLVFRHQNALPAGVPLIGKDSGIAACEAIAVKGGKTAAGEGETTAEQYRELREVFSGSRYAEIRDPGVRFVDLVRQVDQLGKDPGMEALAFIGPLTESYAALAGGCAAHGHTLPSLAGR